MPDTRLGKQNRRREHYDRFDGSEMERRWSAVRERMRAAELDALVVAGDAGFGRTHIGYLTNYHPPFVSYFVFFADPDRPSLLLAGLSNHKQYVREVSEADDVEIMLPDPMGRVADRLEAGGAADGRVGIVGHHPRYDQGLSHEHYVALSGSIRGELVDATRTLIEVGSVKSEPELERIRRAAELTDLGLETLAETAEPGVTERDLRDALTERYLDTDGGLGIAFITSAPMEGAESGEPLPWHKPSGRELREGDVITTEMSAAHRGYRSQVHRTFVVGAEPSDVYGDLWETARTAYDRMLDAIRPGNTVRDVHEALGVIERSPYRLYDVGLHGYGNGYLPPYVGTAASNYWPAESDPVTEEWTFRENQVVVVQPNVVTESERHGLQLGSAVIVREGGPEVLQTYPLPIVEL
jgi:Xaa-Pro aminopeptidase